MQLIKFTGLTDAQNAAFAKLITYKVDYNKLWDTETGRSLDGTFSGTLIGLFPKITITIKAPKNPVTINSTTYTTRQIEQMLLKVFNSDYNSITYFDPYKNKNVTKTFYFGDISAEVVKAVQSSKMKFGKITIEAVATKKLSNSD